MPSGKLLPVLVFFHGGNYKSGGAGVMLYDGSFIANLTNLIVVTVNYRLASMGFTVTENLNGNFGISDQRLALIWVQQNIKAFGGDSNSVTIWGQSAGAGSVHIHMISPASRGLFHRIISESNPISIEYKTRDEAIVWGNKLAKFLNCLNTQGKADEACMRGKTFQEVLAAQLQVSQSMLPFPQPFKASYTWSPNVADFQSTIPIQPLDAFTQGKFTPVPMMLGSVKEEGIQFVRQLFDKPIPKKDYALLLDLVFGFNNSAALTNMYPIPSNETADSRDVLSVIATHYTFFCGNRLAARAFSKRGVPTFVYAYDHILSLDIWGANFSFCAGHVCHGSELPIIFDTAKEGGFQPTADEDILTRRWLHFTSLFAYGATNTMPGPDSSPAWPLYSAASDQVYRFDTPNVNVQSGRWSKFCDLWDTIGYLKF
jgi:acetylcholinesterase/cholinesterase